MSGFPAWGSSKGIGNQESDFEGQWDLITGLPQDWGKTETPLLEGTDKTLYAPGPGGRRSDPTGD